MAGDKQVMVFGIDDSDHSFYALEWTLKNFFATPATSNFKLVIVHARRTPTSVIGLGGPGTTEIMPLVEADLKKAAENLTKKTTDLCKSKNVEGMVFEVVQGDARNVMCEAVEKYKASILVLGSHGYGAFKRAVLGSVSDYCSHHAHCSVMIVKNLKH